MNDTHERIYKDKLIEIRTKSNCINDLSSGYILDRCYININISESSNELSLSPPSISKALNISYQAKEQLFELIRLTQLVLIKTIIFLI
jgi:hypothetical protein